jgi:hypothetical protein
MQQAPAADTPDFRVMLAAMQEEPIEATKALEREAVVRARIGCR